MAGLLYINDKQYIFNKKDKRAIPPDCLLVFCYKASCCKFRWGFSVSFCWLLGALVGKMAFGAIAVLAAVNRALKTLVFGLWADIAAFHILVNSFFLLCQIHGWARSKVQRPHCALVGLCMGPWGRRHSRTLHNSRGAGEVRQFNSLPQLAVFPLTPPLSSFFNLPRDTRYIDTYYDVTGPLIDS